MAIAAHIIRSARLESVLHEEKRKVARRRLVAIWRAMIPKSDPSGQMGSFHRINSISRPAKPLPKERPSMTVWRREGTVVWKNLRLYCHKNRYLASSSILATLRSMARLWVLKEVVLLPRSAISKRAALQAAKKPNVKTVTNGID